MSKSDKIKDKILALRNMISERGATEAEAMAALAKADKLMEQHGLTEADLDVAEAKRDMRAGSFKYGIKTQHPRARNGAARPLVNSAACGRGITRRLRRPTALGSTAMSRCTSSCSSWCMTA